MKRRRKDLELFFSRFSNGGATGETDPTGNENDPVEAGDDGGEDGDNEPAENDVDISDLQQKLAAAEKARKAAENALTLEKSAHSKLKRQNMTESELLAEKTREAEEKATEYARKINASAAEKLFIKAGLDNAEYDELLDVIVSDDENKTSLAAQAIVDAIDRLCKLAARAEREKMLKETPTPPAGDASGSEQTLSDQIKGQLYR